jgi:SAM-dependent methyltransferase
VLEAEMTVRLPDRRGPVPQDEEWCEVAVNGGWRRIRFHDYGDVYAVPGLYEHLFRDLLQCQSPETVVGLLAEQLATSGVEPESLAVLDLGAGNGMVGEALADMGAGRIVGVDIVPEAGEAVDRDRPGLYARYHVCDLLDPPPRVARSLASERFNALTSVAALGFGDIPPEVFQAAFDLVDEGGWVAFTLKEDFLLDAECSGFCGLIEELVESGSLEVCARRRYRHRVSVAGEPLYYVAMVGRKRA